ncbi:hypothetical protein OG874_25730 [Nocardia sp. NBC_00565]|uniref:hypothetical protein n=1 Tax=Nocardia sp. NBC_00565 TaxID=2975993 RepID=UPI002E81EB3A|nr:hypothetical protein [Nocardia sp. NBC_00565]WUC00291.1 hypothetical protein OG874_25730 [Nocardia sp. NBC_00565]
MDEYRTEVDGWLAEWRIDHHRIRIMLVCNGSDSKPLASFTPASAPDLAQMRELFPNLSGLWDAIRHEYWAEVFPPPRPSRGRIRSVNDRRLRPVPIDPMSARIQALTVRARRAGYRLVRSSTSPYDWTLLDGEDCAPSYSAVELEKIEQWLNE